MPSAKAGWRRTGCCYRSFSSRATAVSIELHPTQLRLIRGPGDDGEPVMTVLLPHED